MPSQSGVGDDAFFSGMSGFQKFSSPTSSGSDHSNHFFAAQAGTSGMVLLEKETLSALFVPLGPSEPGRRFSLYRVVSASRRCTGPASSNHREAEDTAGKNRNGLPRRNEDGHRPHTPL